MSAADINRTAADLVQVKGVHGLTHFQQGVVGDIDHVADGAQATQSQVTSHPAGRLTHSDVADIVCHVAGAQVRSFHLDGDGRVRLTDSFVIHGRHVEGLAEDGRYFAGNAQNGLAIRAVCGNGDIKNVIIQADDRSNVRAGNGILRQDEQAVDLSAREQIIVQAQLLAGA